MNALLVIAQIITVPGPGGGFLGDILQGIMDWFSDNSATTLNEAIELIFAPVFPDLAGAYASDSYQWSLTIATFFALGIAPALGLMYHAKFMMVSDDSRDLYRGTTLFGTFILLEIALLIFSTAYPAVLQGSGEVTNGYANIIGGNPLGGEDPLLVTFLQDGIAGLSGNAIANSINGVLVLVLSILASMVHLLPELIIITAPIALAVLVLGSIGSFFARVWLTAMVFTVAAQPLMGSVFSTLLVTQQPAEGETPGQITTVVIILLTVLVGIAVWASFHKYAAPKVVALARRESSSSKDADGASKKKDKDRVGVASATTAAAAAGIGAHAARSRTNETFTNRRGHTRPLVARGQGGGAATAQLVKSGHPVIGFTVAAASSVARRRYERKRRQSVH